MQHSVVRKTVSLLSPVGMLLFAVPAQAARDLPSSTNGGCPAVTSCGGTAPYLGSFPAVTTLTGSNFTVTISPYVWGQVSGLATSGPYSVYPSAATVVNVAITASNPNVRMVAIAVAANLSNAGYVLAPTMSTPQAIPYTGSITSNLSLSDPIASADAGYTLWALGASSPRNVALLFPGVPNTPTAPSQVTPVDSPAIPIPYSVSSQTTNGLTQPSSASSYAVVVYNGTGYEIVGGLPLAGEPGPCGGTQINASVTCHTAATNIALTGAGFTDLTRADNAPTSTTASTTLVADDAAVCTTSLGNSSLMYFRETYTYMPSTNQMVTLSTAGSHYGTVLTVTGGSVSKCSTHGLNGTDSQAALGGLALTAGTQYTIIVGEYPPLLEQPQPPPPADTCYPLASVATPCPFSSDPVLHFALTVTPDSTTTAVTCSPGTVPVGQMLSCTATIADTTNATNVVTGNVQFTFTASGSSSPSVTQTGTIANGTAKASTASLLAGTYQVVATLEPSSGVFLSSSNATPVVVTLTSSTTSASASSISPLAGANFNITGTVTGGTGSPQPTGTAQLFDGTTQVGSGVSLASAAYTIPVSGAAQGTHSYTVHYSGDSAYTASVSGAVQVVVGKDASTVVLAASNTMLNLNGALTLIATVSNGSGTGLIPSGTVTFMIGSMPLIASVVNGVATLPPSALTGLTATAGTYAVSAQYVGDANFNGSGSNALSIVVVSPDFSLKAEQTSVTIAEGQSGTSKIDLAAIGGYVQTVTFACSGLPANATCTFSPASLTPDAAGDPISSTLTVATGVNTASLDPLDVSQKVFVCLLMSGLMFARRRRRLSALLAAFGAVSLGLLLAGCGGGGGKATPVTPAGTYAITVTASPASGASRTASVSFTVTQ